MNNDNTSAGMTRFTDSNLFFDGSYLMYVRPDGKRDFVARFRFKRDYKGFVSFLKKHFTVDEYFTAYGKGTPPSDILRMKGYVSATCKATLKRAGYPQTLAGLNAYVTRPLMFTKLTVEG